MYLTLSYVQLRLMAYKTTTIHTEKKINTQRQTDRDSKGLLKDTPIPIEEPTRQTRTHGHTHTHTHTQVFLCKSIKQKI